MVEDRPAGAPASRRADAIANRKRLIEAAREAFAELGVLAEVKDIAERAGVGVGTIYRHFDNKEDLLREVIVEALAEFDRSIGEGDRPDDPVDLLRRYLTALLTTTENYGWLMDAILGGQIPEGVKRGIETHRPDVQLAATLARGIEAGHFDPELDIEVATNLLLGLSIAWKYGNLRELMATGDAVERSLRLFLHGAARRA